MDISTIRAFRDEFEKIAGTPAEEANKFIGLPLDGSKPGTHSYEAKQAKDEEFEQEALAHQEQQAMEAAMNAPAPAPKKKPAKKKGGTEKVKVEVKVDGKKSDAKVSEPKKPKSKE